MCSLSPSPLSPLCASLSSSRSRYFFHFSILDLVLFCLCLWASVLSPLCLCVCPPVCQLMLFSHCILISKCFKRLNFLKSLKCSSGGPQTPLPDFRFASCHLLHYSRVCRSVIISRRSLHWSVSQRCTFHHTLTPTKPRMSYPDSQHQPCPTLPIQLCGHPQFQHHHQVCR